MTTQVEAPGWGDPGSIRHAEIICHVPAVDLRHHDKWDAYPINAKSDGLDPTPVDDLEYWHDTHDPRIADLVESTFGALEPPCANARCARREHPTWEMHEDADGNGWFAGEAPR